MEQPLSPWIFKNSKFKVNKLENNLASENKLAQLLKSMCNGST
jgi:hypothetical protein